MEGHVSSSPQHLGYGLDEIYIQWILLKHGFSCDPYRVCDPPVRLNIVCFDEYPGVNMQQLPDNTEDTFTDINEVLSHLQQ